MVGFYCQFVCFGCPLHLIQPASIKANKEAAEMLRQLTFELGLAESNFYIFVATCKNEKTQKLIFWSKTAKTVVLIQKSLADIKFSVMIAV